jgi:hypothetical protein
MLVVEVHAYRLSTWETETGGLRFLGQPGLHKQILSQKKLGTKIKNGYFFL